MSLISEVSNRQLSLSDGRRIFVDIVSSPVIKKYMFVKGEFNQGRRGGNKPSLLVLQKKFITSSDFEEEFPWMVNNFCDHIKSALPEFIKADANVHNRVIEHTMAMIERRVDK